MSQDLVPGRHGSAPVRRINGIEIPAIGFGTYGMAAAPLQNVLMAALSEGFRHIDTAQMYQNESDVGTAVKASPVPREEIFLTTKVWVGNYAPSRFQVSVDESLRKLQTDYIDLLLVHWPRVGGPIALQMEGLNRAVDAGKVRYIGVSNYNAAMFDAAQQLSRHPLVTNQVEYHPFLDQTALLRHAEKSRSSLMAYCAMAVGRVFQSPIVHNIGQNHKRTVAQVVLRWLLQQPNVVTLSRTENINRISGNLRVFDFQLSQAEMDQIHALAASGCRIVNPPQLAPDWD